MSDDSAAPEPDAPAPKLVYHVQLDLPGLHKGAAVQFAGLGTFENGSKFDINEEEHVGWRAYHSVQNVDWKDNGDMVVETVPGPTFAEAHKDVQGVKVTTAKGGGK